MYLFVSVCVHAFICVCVKSHFLTWYSSEDLCDVCYKSSKAIFFRNARVVMKCGQSVVE